MSKIKNGGLHQYDPEHFGWLIFATVRKTCEMKGLIDIGHQPVKTVPKMTYNVLSGTLSLYIITTLKSVLILAYECLCVLFSVVDRS